MLLSYSSCEQNLGRLCGQCAGPHQPRDTVFFGFLNGNSGLLAKYDQSELEADDCEHPCPGGEGTLGC